jgi:hypothetical protein
VVSRPPHVAGVLPMLAENGFNRFQPALGMGYDFLRQVTDAYFLFAYPFLVAVPGYSVRAVNLPDSERAHHLEMLRFIREQIVAHGCDFSSVYGCAVMNGRRARSELHHCRPRRCPPHAVLPRCTPGSVARMSGDFRGYLPHSRRERSRRGHDFGRTAFEGAARCGRKIELDLRAKGIDEHMIDTAPTTGLPLTVSVRPNGADHWWGKVPPK